MCIPGHTSLLGTLALTETTVTADAAGGGELTGTGAGVHGDGLADDEAIADELADGLAGVGVGDLIHLIGVEPNLALAAAHHGGGEALLGAKVDPVWCKKKQSVSMKSKPIGGLLLLLLRKSAISRRIRGVCTGEEGGGYTVQRRTVIPPLDAAKIKSWRWTHILMSAYRRSLADDVRCTRRRVEFPGRGV